MAALGDCVRYNVPEIHHTKTVRGEKEIEGSVHHPGLRAFAGIVGAVNEDGTHSIMIFPPNHAPVWVDSVPAEHFDIKG